MLSASQGYEKLGAVAAAAAAATEHFMDFLSRLSYRICLGISTTGA
jgi:hypothetical protein